LAVAPLTAVCVGFFALPMAIVILVSFFDYQTYQPLIPAITLQNYVDVFSASVTYRTYLITMRFCLIVWALTLVIALPSPIFSPSMCVV
jgi:putative spermidine/putrescine transport system permease protein